MFGFGIEYQGLAFWLPLIWAWFIAFAVAGMSAWMILRARAEPPEKVEGARRSLSMALWFAAIFAPVQIVLGDLHGLNVLREQPTKLAAIEANWTRRAAETADASEAPGGHGR